MAVIQDTNQADIVTTTTTPASTAAADQISAGDGNDTVHGGSGNDLLHSDCGTDRADHAGARRAMRLRPLRKAPSVT